MIRHPDDSTIELFVMGALDDDDAFVAHVGDCEECSRKLRREAMLELSMMTVGAELAAEESPPVDAKAASPQRRARRVIGPALAFAAAAAALIWFGRDAMRSRQRSADVKPVPVVACPDGSGQVACIAEAHRVGAHLEYPQDNSLAALGSTLGLTVMIEPRGSDGPVDDFEEFVAKAEPELKRCAEEHLTSQDAPVITGEVGVEFSLSSDGVVTDPRSTVVIGKPFDEAFRQQPSHAVKTSLAIARCLSSATSEIRFKAPGRTTRVRLAAKYVWRE